jgi:hypothetical protein
LQILQGLVGDRWLAGATEEETVTVTGAALDEANDGMGKAFGAEVCCGRFEVVLTNLTVDAAMVLLEVNVRELD